MATTLPYMDINLHVSDSHYAFLSPSNPTSPTLVIDRPSGDLRLTEGRIPGAKRVSSIAGILGIIKLRLDRYVIVINKSQPVGKVKGAVIHKVFSTDLLPLRERALHDPDEDAYINLLKYSLKASPLYFSYALDLTNSFQRQAKCDPSQPLWRRADDRFFWNKFIASDFIDFSAGNSNGSGFRLALGPQPAVDPYILPAISGMLSIQKTSIKGQSLTFALLTRKSRHRTGTRYFSRGIDENGHVSNFNETEQIAVLNNSDSFSAGDFSSSNGSASPSSGRDVQIISYVQTRGSVPVYWAEVNKLKYTPELQIRGVDSAIPAAKLHFDEQIRTYGDNYLINLVNQKGREKGVKEAYEQLVRSLQSSTGADPEKLGFDNKSPETVHVIESPTVRQEFDRLHYVYFDFHNETKGLKWHRAQLLLDQLHEPLMKQQYFHGVYPSSPSNTSHVEVRAMQKSVVRTNCMDCLDRTNVIQSMLGRFSLTRALHNVQFLHSSVESPFDDSAFEDVFRNMWADNADTISRAYSGTGALKTDFTRTGERTKRGALQDAQNSMVRYARNNFSDGSRQDAYDLFSGAFLPLTSTTSTSTSRKGTAYTFVDHRPIPIQSIPYLLLGSLIFLLTAFLTRRLPDSTLWPLRMLTALFTAIAAYCGNFMIRHGPLYVDWPKLRTPAFAVEGYGDALRRAGADPVVGPLLGGSPGSKGKGDGGHSYGKSDGSASGSGLFGGLGVGSLEEGKKRTE